MADISLLFLAVDAEVAFPIYPSCGAANIRAKYLLGVHGLLSCFEYREFALNPYFCKDLSLTTIKWSGTTTADLAFYPENHHHYQPQNH